MMVLSNNGQLLRNAGIWWLILPSRVEEKINNSKHRSNWRLKKIDREMISHNNNNHNSNHKHRPQKKMIMQMLIFPHMNDLIQ